MKIAGLSTTTGVSVATLKFYLRKGLLLPGKATAINQAEYDDTHVRRVKLIRSLVDLGRLSIAEVGRVLGAVDDESLPVHDAFGLAQDAMVPDRERDDDMYSQALAEVDRFVRRHGMNIRPQAAVRSMLADSLVSMAEFGCADADRPVTSEFLDGLVPAIMANAEVEIAMIPEPADRASQVEYTVVGTIACEVATSALRRMALEHASSQRFGTKPAKRRL